MKYIFIDIDGVLNPDSAIDGTRTVPVDSSLPEYLKERYPLSLNNQQGTWLKELSRRTGARLVWGTSWAEYSNKAVGSKIGLPRMDYLRIPRENKKKGETYGQKKAETVDRYTSGDKFVYFDDQPDLGPNLRGFNGLHIYTDPRVGITYSHIQLAEKFLNAPE